MPSDILIIPNRNSTTAAPVMQFSGSQANNIRLEVLTSGSLAFLGRSGSLFSINDSLSGSLMAVGDISGLPIFEVFSDDRVVMGKFNSNALVVTGSNVGIGKSNPAYSLDVSGSAFLSRPGTVQFNINSTDNGSKEFVFRDGGSVVGYVWNVSGYMAIGGGSTTTSMFVTTSNGNVGIRKSNPSVALDVSGSAFVTGSLSLITAAGTGAIITAPSALANTEAGLFRIADSANTNRKLFFGIDNTVGTHGASYIQSVLTGTTNLPLILNPNAGSVLIGTSTDSNNGRLQLPVTTTSAGGIGFGTETSLYRYQAGGLVIDHTNGTAPAIMLRETGTSTLRIETNSQVGYISTLTANSLILRTNGTNALTVTSTQQIAIGKTTANAILDVNGNTVITGSLSVRSSAAGIVLDTGAAADGRMEFKYNGTREGLISVDSNRLNIQGDTGTDVVMFTTGNTNQLVVSSSGNVGVGGVSSVASRLHVYESTSGVGDANGLTIEQAGTSDSVIQFLLTATQRWSMGIDNSDSDKFKICTGTLGSADRVVIHPSGNVGIGNSNPLSLLHVTGSTPGDAGTFSGSGSLVQIKQNTAWSANQPWALFVEGYSYLSGFRINGEGAQRALYKTAAGGELGFAVAGNDPITFTQNDTSERMRIAAGGNVGIGTSAPTARLDVSGSVLITGSLTVTGSVMSVISNTGLRVIRASNTDQILTLTGGDGGGIASVSAGYQLNLNSADAAYPMTFQIGSSEKMRITSAGNVAIGKTTANAVLDVNGNTIITGSLTITGGITGSSGLGLFAGGSNTNVTLTPNGSGYVNVVQSTSTVETPNYALTVGIASTSNLVSLGNHTNYAWLQSWNSRPLAINPAGNNVGIGTTAPNYKLQVNGTIFASGSGFSNSASETGYRLKFYDNGGIANDAGIGLEGSPGAEVMWFNALNGFYFNYGTGGQKVTFTSNGNVAINKSTANATLDVSGSMFITGSLNISSSGFNPSLQNTVSITGSVSVNSMVTATGLTLLQPGFTTSRIISSPGDFTFYSGSTSNPILEIDSIPSSLSTKVSTGNTNTRLILAAESSGATSTFTLPSANDIAFAVGTASLNVPLGIISNKESYFSGSLQVARGGGGGNIARIIVGNERVSSGDAYIYLVGDTTYTNYGLGVARGSTGANATSFIDHRGTGDFTVGCSDGANLIFKTNNSTRVVVTNTGNVGINKSTANGTLDVNGNTIVTGSFSATTNAVIGTENSTRLVLNGLGGPAAITEYYLNESFPRWAIGRDLITGGQAGIGFSDSLNTIATTGGAVAIPTTRVLAFYTSNATTLTERMRIDGSGNVAIGKTTANAKLDVNGNTIITGSLTVTDGIKFKGDGSDILHPFLFITFF